MGVCVWGGGCQETVSCIWREETAGARALTLFMIFWKFASPGRVGGGVLNIYIYVLRVLLPIVVVTPFPGQIRGNAVRLHPAEVVVVQCMVQQYTTATYCGQAPSFRVHGADSIQWNSWCIKGGHCLCSNLFFWHFFPGRTPNSISVL